MGAKSVQSRTKGGGGEKYFSKFCVHVRIEKFTYTVYCTFLLQLVLFYLVISYAVYLGRRPRSVLKLVVARSH